MKKLAAQGLTADTAKAKNYPALNRALVGSYPPGSTFKPVTALAAMQQHLVSPYAPEAVHGHVHGAGGPRAPGLQELGSVRQRGDRPADRARDLVRHVLLRARQQVLRAARELRPSAAGVGEQLRVRPPHRHRRRAGGGRPAADARVAAADVHREDRSVLLAPRQPLEAGRLDPARDRPEGPARHAAADGALLRADRERRQARDAAPAARASTSRSPAAPRRTRPRPRRSRSTSTPARSTSSASGLLKATHDPLGTSSAVFGGFPVADRRQDRNRGEGGRPGRRGRAALQPVVVVRLRARTAIRSSSSAR